jgi:hypothetical protein
MNRKNRKHKQLMDKIKAFKRENRLENLEGMSSLRMFEIEQETGLTHNQIFCGYIRQPIKYDGEQISGYCSLRKGLCAYDLNKDFKECKYVKKYSTKMPCL